MDAISLCCFSSPTVWWPVRSSGAREFVATAPPQPCRAPPFRPVLPPQRPSLPVSSAVVPPGKTRRASRAIKTPHAVELRGGYLVSNLRAQFERRETAKKRRRMCKRKLDDSFLSSAVLICVDREAQLRAGFSVRLPQSDLAYDIPTVPTLRKTQECSDQLGAGDRRSPKDFRRLQASRSNTRCRRGP